MPDPVHQGNLESVPKANKNIIKRKMDLISQAESRPLAALSVFSFIPARRTEPKERSYFNSNRKAPEIDVYDCVHRRPEGFNNKLHRDDRVHAKSAGLDFLSEERSRPVAVRSSSEYGRRPPALSRKPKFSRVAHIRAEFYRKNGITTVEEAYGSERLLPQ